MNTIITIGRQYGSGGREIGKILSERYEVINHIVPYGKDVNDYLCHLKNINKNF